MLFYNTVTQIIDKTDMSEEKFFFYETGEDFQVKNLHDMI